MPEICCLLGLCCPPEERLLKIAGWLAAMSGANAEDSHTSAKALIAHVDADSFVQHLQGMAQKLKH